MAEQEEQLAQEQEMYGEDLEEVYEDEIPVDGEAGAQGEDADELAAMKQKLAEMEAEAAKLRQLQGGGSADGAAGADAAASKEEADGRSIYVGNVDYACTPEELQNHFQSCGTVNRVTILTDKFGSPKGYAYIEFMEVDAVSNALLLDNSEVHGRQIKVSQKRTNVPGLKVRGRGRGRGGFGFGRGGGFPAYGAPFMPYGMPYGYGMPPAPFMGGRGRGGPGFAPRGRGRGGGGRAGFFNPY